MSYKFRLSVILLVSAAAILTACKKKDTISIDIASKEVSGYGDTVVVQVKSNTTWYVTSDRIWATPSLISSKGDETVSIVIAPNATGTRNEAVITFKAGEASAKLIIYRDAASIVAYKTGDLFPNAENPIGMVYEIIGMGMHGKIISFVEMKNIAWGSSISPTYATNMDDGFTNFLTVKALNKTLDAFPAFAWCESLSKNGRIWYLPACRDLGAISENISNINAWLQQIPQAVPLRENIYWSSTESGANASRAYAVSLSSGVAYDVYEKNKDSLCAVRAVSDF
jgi:hypothetical protein